MCKAIYFDMDGTIADLYGVTEWEAKLNASDVTPYKDAEPLWDMGLLNDVLEQLKALGVTVGVISWLAKYSNKEYDKATREAKKEWLKKYLPSVTEIHLVKYGTPKHYVPKIKTDAILIDDNADVCKKWSRGETVNPLKHDIISILENILIQEKKRYEKVMKIVRKALYKTPQSVTI